jgi:hypothetical protein
MLLLGLAVDSFHSEHTRNKQFKFIFQEIQVTLVEYSLTHSQMDNIFLLHCPALMIRSKGTTSGCQLGNLVRNLCFRTFYWQLGPLKDDTLEAAVYGTG